MSLGIEDLVKNLEQSAMELGALKARGVSLPDEHHASVNVLRARASLLQRIKQEILDIMREVKESDSNA